MESEEDRIYGASPTREEEDALAKPSERDIADEEDEDHHRMHSRRRSPSPRQHQQDWTDRDDEPRRSEDDEEDDDDERHARRRSDAPSQRGGPSDHRDHHRGGSSDNNADTMSLLVRHLRFATSPATVRKYFEQCGEVKDVYLPLDYERGNPRGFGFVEFANRRDAETALRELDNTELDGSTISISVAQHGRKTPSTMRQRSSGNRRRYRREPYDRSGSPPSSSYRGGRRYREYGTPRYDSYSSSRNRDEDRGRYERSYDRGYERDYERGRNYEHRDSSRRDAPPPRDNGPENSGSRSYGSSRRGSR